MKAFYWVLIGAAFASVVAMLPDMPYSYFMLLRVVVCGVSLYTLTQIDERHAPWKWGCIALAVLFNPVFKVHLTRELWWWMDGAAAAYFVALMRVTKDR